MNSSILITCDTSTEAYLIRGRLDVEGIECFINNENFSTLMPYMNNMFGGGVQVVVRDEDLAQAREIIKDKIEPDNTNMVCPHCESTDIKLGLGKRKWMKIFNVFIALLTAIPLGNLKPKYYCGNCGEEIR